MRGKTPEDLRLLDLLDPVAEAVGVEIVRLRLMGGAVRRLQIMGERPDPDGGPGHMEIADCTVLARAISDVLDAADPISGEYSLEVSSPGIDRPLTRLHDFDIYQGLEVKIEFDRPADGGRKRFRGVLAGVEGQDVLVDLEGEEETTVIPFAWMAEAKLVLTDELMKRGAAEREARLAAQPQTDESEDRT